MQKRSFFLAASFRKKAFVLLNNKIGGKNTAFLHTLFLENERQTSEKKYGATFFC